VKPKRPRIALFGGSFNPPGNHHRAIARWLVKQFDQVLVIPCGPRPDKPSTNEIEPIYRAAMVDMTFRGMEKVQVELFDLERESFSRTYELIEKYEAQGEIWNVIGTDLIRGGANEESVIQREWSSGKELWKTGNFVVVTRPNTAFDKKDLPPHNVLLEIGEKGSSSHIREAIFHGQVVDEDLTPEVRRYIARHGLYRGMHANRTTRFQPDELKPMLVVDDSNPAATKISKKLGMTSHPEPNVIYVIGGDGAMLRAIRKYWRMRLPFYGINAGHLGFLLNESPPPISPGHQLTLHQLPLLWVETENARGEKHADVAFNDAWGERASGQTAWIQVTVNGKEQIPKLLADAALVSTAAGSASYARAMGAQALPFNTPTLLLVGSNVLMPIGWKSAVLPLDSEVKFSALDPVKRPLNGYIDGVFQGVIQNMLVRLSHTASVELVFDPAHDPAEKLARIQFPTQNS